MEDILFKRIAQETGLQLFQVKNTIVLLDEKATIPFISRYRKEKTGSLDETQVSEINQKIHRYRELVKRKESILQTIEEQGKLTDTLRQKIDQCFDAIELEDIYLPYKPKRKTRAVVAKENGLEPLAILIYKQFEQDPESKAAKFLNEKVETVEQALAGARDIIAEWLNEKAEIRNIVRKFFEKDATIRTKAVKDVAEKADAQKFRDYFDFSEPLRKCPSHRLLAMRRGEEEGFLRLYIEPEDDKVLEAIERKEVKGGNASAKQVQLAVEDAYKRLLKPSLELEFRHLSKAKADEEAIRVFALNLRQLLLAAPLGHKRIMAIDPGYVTGCKVVCLDEQGTFLEYVTIFPHPPQQQKGTAQDLIKGLVYSHQIAAIAIGNGTAGRETETWIKTVQFDRKVDIFMVNENGASIYSASDLAREEFPDKDVTVRGAISIGRRLMDPLAELVKIDPKSIGVGQYQHDVNQSALKNTLDEVVMSCVNAVGVNLNTASKHLLAYVSGIGPQLAENIVTHRESNGLFTSRNVLKKVSRFGDKAFEQAAGFLRIPDATHPLDNSAVHPEAYPLVEKMAKDIGIGIDKIIGNKSLLKDIDLKKYITPEIGLPTLQDIIKELEKPGRDPREQLEAFSFADVHTMNDLYQGMVLPGIVTNITNFGAFVDIGVKQDGMVHISEIANKFIKHPSEVLQLQQKVQVKVTEVDMQRKRIHLSIKQV